MKLKDLVRVIDGCIEIFYDDNRKINNIISNELSTDIFYNSIYKDKLNICSINNYIELNDDEIKIKKKDWKDSGIKWESWMSYVDIFCDKNGNCITDYKIINELNINIFNNKVTRIIPIWYDERVITMVGIEKKEEVK